MRFIYCFLVATICFTCKAQAQQTQLLLPLQKQNKYKFVLADTSFPSLASKDTALINGVNKNYLPVNFYSSHLGAACKMELQLEKQTKLPIRIRLGSKEQVDYLEGKFNRNR
jgi:hypothetical protein